MSEPAPPSAPARLLRRSRTDRIVAGVCGGLGRYLGVDPILLRIAFVILTIAGGSGILIYLVAVLVIPNEAPGEVIAAEEHRPAASGRVLVGTALIAVGTILLIDHYVSWFGKIIWPVALIGIGAAVLVWGARR